MDSASSFDAFKDVLKNYEMNTFSKFNVYRSPKGFLDQEREISADTTIFWKDELPYFHLGSRIYTCHQGKDKNKGKKRKYMETKQEKAKGDHCFQKNSTPTTKKLDCPASITVKRIYALPQFKLENPTRSRKISMSAKIKKKLKTGGNFEVEEAFWYTLPPADAHIHPLVENLTTTEPVHPAVRSKIKELVRGGKRYASVISELLESYVTTELKQHDKSKRCFFPKLPTIKNIMREEKREIRQSKIDGENIEKLLENVDENFVFFRPCPKESTQQEEESEDQEEIDEGGVRESNSKSTPDQNFLFVYQNGNMRRLYRRYAGEAVLLDATYKVCKYAVPLYFLVVQTNVNFQVVAVIMSEYETTASILEALNIVKAWNPDIHPKNAMVNFTGKESAALETAFPGINVFIGSFHREQAWNKWLSQSKNSSIPRDRALLFLRNVANAPGEEELQQALEDLKTWEYYASTPLKKYFETAWEPEIARWSLAHKPDCFFLNTNNGVERLNEELDYQFLDGYKNSLLSEIINVIISNFLPQRYETYVIGNLMMSEGFMEYNEEIPTFLHERPEWIIEHFQERLDCREESTIERIEEGSFSISSKNRSWSHIVKFKEKEKKCSCTCSDYRRKRLPCKHCLMVGKKFHSYHISRIGKWLLSNPLFCCDYDSLHTKQNDEQENPEVPVSSVTRSGQERVGEDENFEVMFSELEKRGKVKRKVINKCNSHIRNLSSVLWTLEEDELMGLEKDLQGLTRKYKRK